MKQANVAISDQSAKATSGKLCPFCFLPTTRGENEVPYQNPNGPFGRGRKLINRVFDIALCQLFPPAEKTFMNFREKEYLQ